jgi:hypothetical protein
MKDAKFLIEKTLSTYFYLNQANKGILAGMYFEEKDAVFLRVGLIQKT